MGITKFMWIPVGLLENPDGEVAIHLHVASKARWDRIPTETCKHEEMPSLQELQQILSSST
ncbi:hypothetical protein V5J34_003027 [Endozoicomonas sp. NE35]